MGSTPHFTLNGLLQLSFFGLEEDQEKMAVPDSLIAVSGKKNFHHRDSPPESGARQSAEGKSLLL
jgi:hypothetical protein